MSGVIDGAGSKSGVIGETELDYEEGTWMTTGIDPKNGGDGSWTIGSYNMETVSIQMARYVKVGRQVTCWWECLVRYITYAANGNQGSSNTAYGGDGLYLYDNRLPFAPDALYTYNGPACGAISIASNTFGTYGPPVFVRADFNSFTTVGNCYPGTLNTSRVLAGWVTYLTAVLS